MVGQEYDRLSARLGRSPVESLLDLLLMADPAQRATMDVLTALSSPTRPIRVTVAPARASQTARWRPHRRRPA